MGGWLGHGADLDVVEVLNSIKVVYTVIEDFIESMSRNFL
jgi:hypothetical protein